MRRVKETKKYRKDFERQVRRGKEIKKLIAVIDLLIEDGALPSPYWPHSLRGEWHGTEECHIESDWLLIYATDDMTVKLYRTGTHADLFE